MMTVPIMKRLTQQTAGCLTGMLLAGVMPAVVLATSVPAQACTSLVLPTTDGARIYGRTMEFEFDMKSALIALPRRLSLKGTGPQGKVGLAWRGKYAAIGMNAFGLPLLLDGMNEKGLTGGILYFPGEAKYAPWESAQGEHTLAPWEVLTWALTNFATVAEVKAALKDIRVADVKQAQMGFTPPVHYTLHDATGASLVIEPQDGRLKVYDNPLGVLTNSPSFDWHLTNLRNYVNLHPENVPPLKIGNVMVHPLGNGSGMHGIPGDATPPSRFVKAAAYVLATQRVTDGAKGVRLVEHIMNNFDIPKGLVLDEKTPPEYTQWTSVADLGEDRYYVKTWEVPVLHGVGFSDFDMNGASVVRFPLPADGTPSTLKLAAGS